MKQGGVGTMPICVDGRMLTPGGTGVSTYARSLVAATRRIGDTAYRLVARRTDDGWLRKCGDAWHNGTRRLQITHDADGPLIVGRDIFRRAHVHFNMRNRLYRIGCDVEGGIMHWTYPVPMMMVGWINLYTVHDAIPLDRPELTSINPRRHHAVLSTILAEGGGITTVTQAARAAIVSTLRCDPRFVTDTGQPVDVGDAMPHAEPLAGLKPGKYFLVIGSIEPRKNLTRILAAYRRSRTPLPLVIVGPDGWRADPILADIAVTPGAMRLPYVEREALLGLIAHARALVFASLAEGFGLPLVEAMALGTPVLTSDNGALAEVAGGAALTVAPTNVPALADAFTKLTINDALVRDLSAKGITRAAYFSADRFVARLTQVYGDALQRHSATANGRHFNGQRRGSCGSE